MKNWISRLSSTVTNLSWISAREGLVRTQKLLRKLTPTDLITTRLRNLNRRGKKLSSSANGRIVFPPRAHLNRNGCPPPRWLLRDIVTDFSTLTIIWRRHTNQRISPSNKPPNTATWWLILIITTPSLNGNSNTCRRKDKNSWKTNWASCSVFFSNRSNNTTPQKSSVNMFINLKECTIRCNEISKFKFFK